MLSDRVARPSALVAVDTPKSWGGELWLTSTRSEAPATIAGTQTTLAALVASHPEVLGGWARRLFGDEMPMFAKVVRTDFPPRVHMGFRRTVSLDELLGWLETEQALLRSLLGALRARDEGSFGIYQARYSAWASEQALAGWRRDDDAATAAALAAFVDGSLDLATWLRQVRENRAAFADALNEVDLPRETGQLLLMGAGVIHAIFGLSHQTHPPDHARPALQALFATLRDRAAAGATDDELARTIDRAGLAALRANNVAPPKNEAWLPIVANGSLALVEPQQTSDTTYSLADFYTPLVWAGGDRARFRKGDAASGLSREVLRRYLADVDRSATSVDALRRRPTLVGESSRKGAELFRLVDEPAVWPFFTAYQLQLEGTFCCRPPPGVFQELIVTAGRVELRDGAGDGTGEGVLVGELSPGCSGFIPGTLSGAYTLHAREAATVLLLAVPGARGGAPQPIGV